MTPAEFAYRHRIAILLVILVSCFMAVLDNNIVAIALPTITAVFGVPLGMSQWIATAYMMTIVATVLIFGTLAGRIGTARLFILGLVVFVAASAACGLAGSLFPLITARIVQGLGAAMMMSISMAIIMQVFPADERGRAMGYITATVALGLIVGPALGGILVDSFGWPFIFFVNVPIGCALLLLAARYLKVPAVQAGSSRTDYYGAVLLILVMAALAFVLNEFANPPVDPLRFAASAGFGLIALALFVYRERTAEAPLLDLSLVTTRAFMLPGASLVLYFTATFILIILLPFYFEGVMGYAPTQVGLIAFVMPIAMMAASPVCGWIYDKYCPKNYATFGVFGVGLSFLLCGYGYATVNIWLVILALAIAGICRSVYQGPNTIEIMVSIPKEKAGVASSVLVILQDLGVMFGISAAAILLVLQLDALGYTGAVLSAGPSVLPPLFGNAMYIGGAICLLSAAFSYRRDGGSSPGPKP
jgi:drug resistance transporter, EmrB/QacA subfamily